MALLGGFGGGVVGGATVKLLVDDAQFRAGLASAKGETQAAATGMTKFGGAAKAAFAVGGAAALSFGASSVKAFMDAEQVAAQTEAVLKSTGGTANVTADDVGNLAQSISDLSGIDDDAVQASENLLLTFKRIRNEAGAGNDIFDQTTQAVADMATAMNQGAIPSQEQLAQTSIQVGKALNDPIAGMSALARVGVTFSQSQKNVITRLQESGDLMGAQKVVLAELSTEFAGAAKAAGDTAAGGMAKFKNSIGTLQEELGKLIYNVATLGGVFEKLDTELTDRTTAAFTAGGGALKAWTFEVESAQQTTNSWLGNLLGAVVPGFGQATDAVDEQAAALKEHARIFELDGSAAGNLTAAQSAARTEMQHATAAADEESRAVRNLAESHTSAAQAARDQRSAEASLAGGFLAVLDAGQQVAEDERTLQQLRNQGKVGTNAYQAAVRAAIGDQIAFSGAVDDYKASSGGAQGATATLRSTLAAYGGQLGITKGQIAGLLGMFDAEIGKANALAAALNAIPTNVNVTVHTTYIDTGAPHGGIQ